MSGAAFRNGTPTRPIPVSTQMCSVTGRARRAATRSMASPIGVYTIGMIRRAAMSFSSRVSNGPRSRIGFVIRASRSVTASWSLTTANPAIASSVSSTRQTFTTPAPYPFSQAMLF